MLGGQRITSDDTNTIDTLQNIKRAIILLQDLTKVIKTDGGICDPEGIFDLRQTMKCALQYEIDGGVK